MNLLRNTPWQLLLIELSIPSASRWVIGKNLRGKLALTVFLASEILVWGCKCSQEISATANDTALQHTCLWKQEILFYLKSCSSVSNKIILQVEKLFSYAFRKQIFILYCQRTWIQKYGQHSCPATLCSWESNTFSLTLPIKCHPHFSGLYWQTHS